MTQFVEKRGETKEKCQGLHKSVDESLFRAKNDTKSARCAKF
jgi:hypothetical protein